MAPFAQIDQRFFPYMHFLILKKEKDWERKTGDEQREEHEIQGNKNIAATGSYFVQVFWGVFLHGNLRYSREYNLS